MNVKKQLLLSLFVLVLGFKHVGSLYKFSGSKNVDDEKNLSIMNYNVRLFNLYNWIPGINVQKDIVDFIKKESPFTSSACESIIGNGESIMQPFRLICACRETQTYFLREADPKKFSWWRLDQGLIVRYSMQKVIVS